MNILLINHYAGSFRHGMEFRPYYLGREWARAGHRVTVVAADQSHVRTVPVPRQHPWAVERVDPVEYRWVPTPAYSGNGARRAANIFAFAGQVARLAHRLADELRPNLVIASSTHPMDIYGAERVARRAGGTLVYEVHDLWPLSPVELGGMSPAHPFIRVLQAAEDRAYRRADRVVSMLPCARPHMESHGMAPAKWVHVPNGIDVAEWSAPAAPLPDAAARVLEEARRAGRRVVCYAGAHGVANALDVLLRAAARLREEPVSFVLVGQGPERARLIEEATRTGLANVHFVEAVPKAAVPALLGAADLLYLGLVPTPVFRFGVSPNKLLDYLMAGRPIVQAIGAPNDPVADARCGRSVPPGDPDAVADAVRHLLALPEQERIAMGRRGREWVTARHDYRVLAHHFLEACAAG